MSEKQAPAFKSCLLAAERDTPSMPLIRALHSAGFAVLERAPDPRAVSLAASGEFDLVLWRFQEDAALFLGRLAEADIALITVHIEATADEVSASLNAGADACIQLDADPGVIVAQVNAVLRRRNRGIEELPEESGILQIGDLTVDVDRCEVERGGRYIPLTAQEFRIVEFMARNPSRVLRPHEILNAVSEEYDYRPREAQEVFKVAVRRIRRKLEPAVSEPRYLVTVRGFGYRLEGGAERAGTAKARQDTA
jgi:DNA-binding response OmpR family regulator